MPDTVSERTFIRATGAIKVIKDRLSEDKLYVA